MSPRIVASLLAALLLGGCVSNMTRPQDTERRLDAAEVRALFSNRTVESYNRNSGMTSFTYYHPDGRVVQQRYWSRRAGRWRVDGRGRVCLDFGRERCRRVVQIGDTYYKVVPGKGASIRYRRFIEGNLLVRKGERWPRGSVFRP